MNIKNVKKYVNALLALLGFAFIGWLAYLHVDWLLIFGIFSPLPGYFLLLLLFIPARSLPLGVNSEKPPLILWFSKLCLGQLALVLLTIAAMAAYLGAGPSYIEKGEITLSLAVNALGEYRWQWGIFPWGMMGLWGIVLAYVTYVKKGVPYLYQIVEGIFPRRLEPMAKTLIESAAFGATLIAFTLIAGSIILLISYVIEIYFKIHHFALPVITASALFFLMPFISFPAGKKLLRRCAAKNLSLNQFYAFMIGLFVLILIAASFASKWFIQHHPEILTLSQCKQCAQYFGSTPWSVRFAGLYWGWWLLWTPLAGSYIAKISKGRTLQEMVVGVFLVPLILSMSYYIWGNAPLLFLVNHIRHVNVSVLLSLLAIIAWIIFYQFLKGYQYSNIFVSGYMPLDLETENHSNRLWVNSPSKTIGLSKFGPKLITAVAGTLFLHTMGGWYGIQIQVLATSILVINAVYGGLDFLVWQFFKDKTWTGNRNIPPYERERSASLKKSSE